MPAATFDFTNLIVQLPAPTGGFLTMDVQEDIYSDWKVAMKAGDNFAPPAFDTTAGDDLGNAVTLTGTYFLRNDLGWRIRSTDEDQEITLIGNLFARDPLITKYIPRAGRQIVFEILLTANPRQVVTGSAVTAQDKLDIGAQAASDVFATIIENGESFLNQVRLMRAEAAGDIVKVGDVHSVRDAANTKDRIVATADEDGREVTAVDGT